MDEALPNPPDSSRSNRTHHFTVLQSTTEIGLGSLLHAFHVPLAGHFLSLNQGLILTLAIEDAQSRRSAVHTSTSISTVAALLKLLSPMGKRLTPMLAITMQGLLYACGVFIAGPNIVGVILGMMLLSLWGFLQPLILAELIFGQTVWLAIEDTWKKIATSVHIPVEYGIWILIAGVGLKLLLAAAVGISAWYFQQKLQENYISKMQGLGNRLPKMKVRMQSPLKGSIKDLLQPWFLAALLLSVGFLYLSDQTSTFQLVVYFLRTLAIAWLLFWMIRIFPIAWIQPVLERFPGIEKTFRQLRGETDRSSSRTFKS